MDEGEDKDGPEEGILRSRIIKSESKAWVMLKGSDAHLSLVGACLYASQVKGAVCTPEFYLFDAAQRLVYRGRFDASRPNSQVPITGSELRAAAEAVLAGRQPAADQKPSIGCGIKWRPGNAPSGY